MPLTYAVSHPEKLVRVNATGPVNSEDLPAMTASLVADEAIGPGMRFLVEAEHVEPDLTFTDLRNAATALTNLNAKGVSEMAIVTHTTHVYALAQVFLTFAPASTIDVRVFRRLPEALAWLKV